MCMVFDRLVSRSSKKTLDGKLKARCDQMVLQAKVGIIKGRISFDHPFVKVLAGLSRRVHHTREPGTCSLELFSDLLGRVRARRFVERIKVGLLFRRHCTTNFGPFNFSTNHSTNEFPLSLNKAWVVIGALVAAMGKPSESIKVQLPLKRRVFTLPKEP
jgi:hypothetical protein